MVFLVYLVKYQIVDLKNRVRFPKTPKNKAEKITVVVYSPWTREVAGSNPASQTKCRNGEMVDASDLGSEF